MFLRPNINSELILKPHIQNIWETGLLSSDVLIKTVEIRDEMLKLREIWYGEYFLSLREKKCKDFLMKVLAFFLFGEDEIIREDEIDDVQYSPDIREFDWDQVSYVWV